MHQFLILVHQFLSLKRTKKSKNDVNYGKIPTNYNNRVEITNINSNCNSFTNSINHSYLFSVYLLIHIYIYIYEVHSIGFKTFFCTGI